MSFSLKFAFLATLILPLSALAESSLRGLCADNAKTLAKKQFERAGALRKKALELRDEPIRKLMPLYNKIANNQEVKEAIIKLHDMSQAEQDLYLQNRMKKNLPPFNLILPFLSEHENAQTHFLGKGADMYWDEDENALAVVMCEVQEAVVSEEPKKGVKLYSGVKICPKIVFFTQKTRSGKVLYLPNIREDLPTITFAGLVRDYKTSDNVHMISRTVDSIDGIDFTSYDLETYTAEVIKNLCGSEQRKSSLVSAVSNDLRGGSGKIDVANLPDFEDLPRANRQ